jgi:hypothetical protein
MYVYALSDAAGASWTSPVSVKVLLHIWMVVQESSLSSAERPHRTFDFTTSHKEAQAHNSTTKIVMNVT